MAEGSCAAIDFLKFGQMGADILADLLLSGMIMARLPNIHASFRSSPAEKNCEDAMG
jgi:hypothetical protein